MPKALRHHFVSWSMGAPLGSIYDALWQETAWLYRNWSEYVELFGTKPSRVELLNRAASNFFRVVQDALWEQTLLHIARLTDPPGSGKRSNLTIQRLADLIDDHQTAEAVKAKVDAAILAADFCRDWRNRRIAHRDLSLALATNAETLPAASRDKVSLALEAISAVLNLVSQHYLKSDLSFDAGPNPNGAISALYLLEEGLEERVRKQARRERGEP